MTNRSQFYFVHVIVLFVILLFLLITGSSVDAMLAITITYIMAVIISDLIT